MTQGLYLYCIIRCPQPRLFDVAALGEPEGQVHAFCHHGLAAVVSGSPLKQYECSRSHLLAHQRVLEKVMTEFTLLPVRFGTVTDSLSPEEDIQRLLVQKYPELDKLLQEMEGRVELGLKAFWRDERAILAELVEDNPEIGRLHASLQEKPAEATKVALIQLGKIVKEALDKKRSLEAARRLHLLRPLAYRLKENKALVDRMILNVAFLVDKAKVPQFDQAVGHLDEEAGQRIAFKYIGPVPPYNFVNLVVNWKELR